MQLDILAPNEPFRYEKISCDLPKNVEDVLGNCTTGDDLNQFSVISALLFGNFDALLTGDAGPEQFSELLQKNMIKDVEYIKIPHHGSKNGIIKDLLEKSIPEMAVISVGKDNSYGHPHKEVINMLSGNNIKTFRTDELKDIVLKSDGEKVWLER